MDNEKLNELASKIWQRHRSALEFLIEQQPNNLRDFSQEIADSNLPKQISEELKRQGIALTFIPDTSTNFTIRLAVPEWDKAQGMLPTEGEEERKWVASGRMVLMELKVYPDGGVFVRWLVGPGPQEYRKTFIQTLNPDLKRKITDKSTRIWAKPLVLTKEKEHVVNGEWDEELVSRVISDMVKYAIKTVKEYDTKLRNAGLLN